MNQFVFKLKSIERLELLFAKDSQNKLQEKKVLVITHKIKRIKVYWLRKHKNIQ